MWLVHFPEVFFFGILAEVVAQVRVVPSSVIVATPTEVVVLVLGAALAKK